MVLVAIGFAAVAWLLHRTGIFRHLYVAWHTSRQKAKA
jgi:hypothetical protein